VQEDVDVGELRRALLAARGSERVHLALRILQRFPLRTRIAELAFGVLRDASLRCLGDGADAQDDAQETALKLLGALPDARLPTPAASFAWLRRVAKNVRLDRFRREKSKRQTREGYGQERRIQRQPSASSEPVGSRSVVETVDPTEALEPHRVALFAQIESFLEQRQQRTRHTWYRNAELAWKRHVADEMLDELARGAGAAAKNKTTLSQWIKRGREDVILPSLRRWRDALASGEDAGGDAVEAMIAFFEQTRRADAGRARPARRRNVSPDVDGTSVQVEDADVLDQDEPVMDDGDGDD